MDLTAIAAPAAACLSRVTLSLASCVPPPGPAFGFGVSSDMRAAALSHYRLGALSMELHDVPACDKTASDVWHSMEALPADSQLDELFLFVDGSYNPDNGCALVAVGRSGSSVGKLGFFACTLLATARQHCLFLVAMPLLDLTTMLPTRQ